MEIAEDMRTLLLAVSAFCIIRIFEVTTFMCYHSGKNIEFESAM